MTCFFGLNSAKHFLPETILANSVWQNLEMWTCLTCLTCPRVWHVHMSGMCVRRGLGPGQHVDLPHMTGSHFPGLPGFPRPAQVCRDFVKIETSRFWKFKNLPLEDKIHNFWSRRHLDIIPTARYQLCSVDSGENTKSTCFEWNYSGRGKKTWVHVPAFSEAATVDPLPYKIWSS